MRLSTLSWKLEARSCKLVVMRFQVPQFIEVEDKIVGPLTGIQFIYVVGGGGFFVAMWLILPQWLAVLVGGPVALLGAALAFLKINDRPFILTLQSGFEYLFKTKLYIWEKKKPKTTALEDISIEAEKREEDPLKYVPAATSSKIKDLSWSLDIKESIYSDKKQK